MSGNIQTTQHLRYRPDIDGLRAVAVLAVVFFHTYPNLLPGGFAGVDVFFVISGFLISSNIVKDLSNNLFSFKDFYSRRIRRIYPSLLVVLVFLYFFGFVSLFSEEFSQLGKHIAATAAFVANLVYWGESGYFDSSAELKPLLNMWSLGVEEQYYIVWPMLVWVAHRRNIKILSMAVVLAAISFALNIYQSYSSPIADFYSPITRFWELLAGSILAWLYQNVRFLNLVGCKPRFCHGMSLVGLCCIATPFLLLSPKVAFPSGWAIIPVAGCLLIIVAGHGAVVNKSVLGNRFVVWIGKISYPIYLWHWPLISLTYILESGNPSRLQRLGAVALSIFISWLTYRYVERPLRFGASKKIPTILFIFMLGVGAVGYATYYLGGLPNRAVNEFKGSNHFDAPYRESCSSMITETVGGSDWCNKGNSHSRMPDVVLIGDSFSNSYAPMLLELAKEIQSKPTFVQLGHGSCPPMVNFGPVECRAAADEYFEFIVKNKSIDTVVLSADWPAYFSEAVVTWGTGKESRTDALYALKKTIQKYQSVNKKVVVFLSPPQGFSPKSCIDRPFSMRSQRCNLPRSEVVQNDKSYREEFLAVLNSLSVDYFDPFEIFCDQDVCAVEINNEIFSIDGHHLSVLGGKYLAVHGRDKLNNLLLDR